MSAARSTPWQPNDTRVAAALAGAGRRLHHGSDPAWPAPTGDTQSSIRVGRGELTCLGCGDTFSAGHYCERCGQKVNGEPIAREALPPSVPTISYLRSGEYEPL